MGTFSIFPITVDIHVLHHFVLYNLYFYNIYNREYLLDAPYNEIKCGKIKD